jgi:hypothetical protein
MIFDKIKLIYVFIACYELKKKPNVSIHNLKIWTDGQIF